VNTGEDEAHLDHRMPSKGPDLEHGMSSLMMDVTLDASEVANSHSSRPIWSGTNGR
jgi:hypothetical protein